MHRRTLTHRDEQLHARKDRVGGQAGITRVVLQERLFCDAMANGDAFERVVWLDFIDEGLAS